MIHKDFKQIIPRFSPGCLTYRSTIFYGCIWNFSSYKNYAFYLSNIVDQRGVLNRLFIDYVRIDDDMKIVRRKEIILDGLIEGYDVHFEYLTFIDNRIICGCDQTVIYGHRLISNCISGQDFEDYINNLTFKATTYKYMSTLRPDTSTCNDVVILRNNSYTETYYYTSDFENYHALTDNLNISYVNSRYIMISRTTPLKVKQLKSNMFNPNFDEWDSEDLTLEGISEDKAIKIFDRSHRRHDQLMFYFNGYYVCIGHGRILISENAIHWKLVPNVLFSNVCAVSVHNNDIKLIIGNGFLIYVFEHNFDNPIVINTVISVDRVYVNLNGKIYFTCTLIVYEEIIERNVFDVPCNLNPITFKHIISENNLEVIIDFITRFRTNPKFQKYVTPNGKEYLYSHNSNGCNIQYIDFEGENPIVKYTLQQEAAPTTRIIKFIHGVVFIIDTTYACGNYKDYRMYQSHRRIDLDYETPEPWDTDFEHIFETVKFVNISSKTENVGRFGKYIILLDVQGHLKITLDMLHYETIFTFDSKEHYILTKYTNNMYFVSIGREFKYLNAEDVHADSKWTSINILKKLNTVLRKLECINGLYLILTGVNIMYYSHDLCTWNVFAIPYRGMFVSNFWYKNGWLFIAIKNALLIIKDLNSGIIYKVKVERKVEQVKEVNGKIYILNYMFPPAYELSELILHP